MNADALSSGVLASCVNGGGVFRLEAGRVDCLSVLDTTGITSWPGGMVWAMQDPSAARLRIVGAGDIGTVRLSEHPLDLHDLFWNEDTLYVVATASNSVFAFDGDLRERRRWVFDGEPDSQHLNSVCVHDGRLLASRFGDFRTHRGYKGGTRGAGQVVDVETGDVVIEGLSQPHSLRSHAGLLWLCDSETHRVLAYRHGERVVEIPLGGYARGLLFDGEDVLVGLSRSRNDDHAGVENACVVALSGAQLRERARTELPVSEVYDLAHQPGDLSDLRGAAATEALRAMAELRHARNVESLHFGEQQARADALASQAARLQQALQAQTRALAGMRCRMDEELEWSSRQQHEIEALRQRLAGLEDVLDSWPDAGRLAGDALASLHEAVALRDRFGRLVSGSRSWRWTRPLRRYEPPLPPPRPVDAEAAALDALEGSVQRTADTLALPPVEPASQADVPVHGLEFPVHDEPAVSVVVTAFGEFEHTRNCLESIAASGDATPFEVLLVEDASGEARMARFANVGGLRYLANARNMGFLRSANLAARAARGRFLVFLNNDTCVYPGWLDALVRSFDLLDGCGLAGSRLEYPNGELQEAGAIVWSDGSGCNVGRGGNPCAETFQTAREVDYVSGASMIIETRLFDELGGFDERYAPAYYEDTDLAFRVRERGLRVYYQPESRVRHVEGLSHGTDEVTGGKAAQARNRTLFAARWGAELQRGHLAPGEHPFLARARSQLLKSVLVVDRHAPQTDRDAGSRAIWQLLRVMQHAGLAVWFWSLSEQDDPACIAALRRHGIETMAGGPDALTDWLNSHGVYVDNVVLSRPLIAEACIDACLSSTSARMVYYGHDIHHHRIAEDARLHDDPSLAAQAAALQGIEESLWSRMDAVLYPSDEETAHVRTVLEVAGHPACALTVPLFAFGSRSTAVDDRPAALAARREVIFVGGFGHVPNVDGAIWLVREIWPLIREMDPTLRLVLVGADPTDELLASAADDIEVTGRISEESLSAHYARARVAIAPLRFGAGLKGKVVEAMRHGVPCVATRVGAQGFGDAESLRVADDPAAIADAVVALGRDDVAWRQSSRQGQAYVDASFSVQALREVLEHVLDVEPYPDVDARRHRLAAGEGRRGEALAVSP